MTNPNDVIQSKHFDSLAAATAANINVLKSAASTVEGAMWFDTVNDLPVIKFFHDGKEFSFTQNSAPVTNATLTGNSFTVDDKTFALTGFKDDLIFHDGKFFAADDNNHLSPLGYVTAVFDNGVAINYKFHFISFDALVSNLQTGDTVAVIQLGGESVTCSLSFHDSLTSHSDKPDKFYEYSADDVGTPSYRIEVGTQDEHLRKISDNTYTYAQGLSGLTFFLSNSDNFEFEAGAVSVSTVQDDGYYDFEATIGSSFNNSAGISFFKYNADGNELRYENGKLLAFDSDGNSLSTASTGIAEIELRINSWSDIFDFDNLDNYKSLIDVYLRKDDFAGSDADSIDVKVTFAGDSDFISKDKAASLTTADSTGSLTTYNYTAFEVTEGFYTGTGTVPTGHFKHEQKDKGHLYYRTKRYTKGGDSFSVTGLTAGLSVVDDVIYLGDSAVGSITADVTNRYARLVTISDMAAVDTSKLGEGDSITLIDNDTGHDGYFYRLAFTDNLTDYTNRTDYSPAKFEDGTSENDGEYTFTGAIYDDYIEFNQIYPKHLTIAGTSTATSTAVLHKASDASGFVISGLSTGLGDLGTDSLGNIFSNVTVDSGNVTLSNNKIGYIQNKTVYLRDDALSAGSDVSLSSNTGNYNLSLLGNDWLAKSTSCDSFSDNGDGSYTYSANDSTLGFIVAPDRQSLQYNSLNLNGKSFTVSGLRPNLGTLSPVDLINQQHVTSGEFQTQDGEIICRLLNDTITIYQNAFPSLYNATITNSTENISVQLP